MCNCELKYKLYCDMDGVLVNFLAGANKVTKESGFNEGWVDIANKSQDMAWDILSKKGPDFWIDLEWETQGRALWNSIQKYNPVILSAYPYSIEDPIIKTDAVLGKKEWIKRNIGDYFADTAVICSIYEKSIFADKNSILIDDFKWLIKEWENAGGIGILHKSHSETIEKLETLL